MCCLRQIQYTWFYVKIKYFLHVRWHTIFFRDGSFQWSLHSAQENKYGGKCRSVQRVLWCVSSNYHYRLLDCVYGKRIWYHNNVIMGAIASQINSPTIVYSTVYSDVDQGKHQSFASLAFIRGIHRWQENSPDKGPVTRKMFPFDDVIMTWVWTQYDVEKGKAVLRFLKPHILFMAFSHY